MMQCTIPDLSVIYRQIYGSAKFAAVTCDDAVQWRPGSAGMLLANTEMKVLICVTI